MSNGRGGRRGHGAQLIESEPWAGLGGRAAAWRRGARDERGEASAARAHSAAKSRLLSLEAIPPAVAPAEHGGCAAVGAETKGRGEERLLAIAEADSPLMAAPAKNAFSGRGLLRR